MAHEVKIGPVSFGFVWCSDWEAMTVHRCGVFIKIRDYPIKVVWGVW